MSTAAARSVTVDEGFFSSHWFLGLVTGAPLGIVLFLGLQLFDLLPFHYRDPAGLAAAFALVLTLVSARVFRTVHRLRAERGARHHRAAAPRG